MTATAVPDALLAPPARSHEALHFPCGDGPAPGQAKVIAPGVLWLRIPLSTALEHINIWALRDGDGWAIVDCGMFNAQTVAVWQAIVAPDGPLRGKPPTRLLVTHLHSDHVGMAGWLHREWGCELWMTRTEYLQCHLQSTEAHRALPPAALRFYRRAGWDDAALAQYCPQGQLMSPLPASYRRLQDGQQLHIGDQRWQVVVGSGHSPEHACLHCPELGLLISGDQVLPRISSNVSVLPGEPQADPLHDWLSSIAKLRRAMAPDVLVLPAHHEPFRGLHARLDRLAEKRLRSLDQLRRCLAQAPCRAVDTFETLFGRTQFGSPFVLRLATGESLAYLNYLALRGEASVQEDRQGVAWYRATPA